MKNLSTWLILMFMIIFWIFRVCVAFMNQLKESFAGFEVINETVEVVILFIVVACCFLFYKRKLLGGLIYLVSYGYYFGGHLINNLNNLTDQNTMASALALILALFAFLDLFTEKVKLKEPSDKKTDWYFNSKEHDRNLDERADKNHYKFY